MPAQDPPGRNRQGREIWFVSRSGDGAYAPVHPKGCLAFVLAGLWIMVSGAIGFAAFAAWMRPAAFVLMFAVAVPGLLAMAITVYRHS